MIGGIVTIDPDRPSCDRPWTGPPLAAALAYAIGLLICYSIAEGCASGGGAAALMAFIGR